MAIGGVLPVKQSLRPIEIVRNIPAMSREVGQSVQADGHDGKDKRHHMVERPDRERGPVRTALVGLGGHGRTIQEAVESAANLEVVAVYDVVDAERRASAERFGCDAPSSYDAVLQRDDLEAVVLVTPNHLHRPQAEAAFAAGMDVFVEKPIANTVEDGLAIIDAAERSGRLVMVGHNMRFALATQNALEFLLDGRLGTVVSVEIHFSADNATRLSADAWRLRPDQCPLLPVMQLGIHGIDLVQCLLGPIRNVYAHSRSVTTRPEVVDSVTAVFELDGGATGTLVSNYCTQVLLEYRIAGTEGTLQCTPHRCWFRRTKDTDGRGDGPAEVYDYTEYDGDSYRLQMKAFGEAVRTRERSEIYGWDGLQALAVVEALQRSATERTPQPVRSFHERRGGAVEKPHLQSRE